MKLSLAKHLLFVEPEGGALGALGPRLLELGLVTLHATTVEAAERIVGSTGLLSLVAIDDAVGLEAGAELLAAIKREHADLPVVWISSRPATAPLSRSEFMPDAILHHPIDVETLRTDVDRLLMEQLYPPSLVQLLADSACEVMFAAYGVTPTVRDRHIRANRNALGTVNAILPFCGRHIAGRVVVGAEEDVLLAIRATTLPHAAGSLLAAEDLAGELANLVAGRMKSHFAGFHFDFELGTPHLRDRPPDRRPLSRLAPRAGARAGDPRRFGERLHALRIVLLRHARPQPHRPRPGRRERDGAARGAAVPLSPKDR